MNHEITCEYCGTDMRRYLFHNEAICKLTTQLHARRQMKNFFNAEIPENSSEAYKEGWRDAIRYLNRKLSKYRDGYLMPETEKKQKELQEINRMLNLLDMASDIQAATAWMQDNISAGAAAEIRQRFEP